MWGTGEIEDVAVLGGEKFLKIVEKGIDASSMVAIIKADNNQRECALGLFPGLEYEVVFVDKGCVILYLRKAKSEAGDPKEA